MLSDKVWEGRGVVGEAMVEVDSSTAISSESILVSAGSEDGGGGGGL